MTSQPIQIIGLMSGTSLDGLDVAYCTFHKTESNWCYSIEKAATYDYSSEWKNRLANAKDLNAFEFVKLNQELGAWMGEKVNDFLNHNQLPKPQYIASHGQTIFHRPELGFTTQIGNGATIAATTGISTICDFRSLDVALQGQGAPLVPIGDELLFNEFDCCVNLGGFANLSYSKNEKRIAYDICTVNFVANQLAQSKGFAFDKNGDIGRSGKVIDNLLAQLEALPFYKQQPPKSLGQEWVEKEISPILNQYTSIEDKLRTCYEHFAIQIAAEINNSKKVLFTGGGAKNQFLMELIQSKTASQIIIPDELIIDFKEALIFAFLGLLRILEEPNCLQSVTGASRNSCGGVIYKI